jgi:hypothetical protein
MTQVLLTTFVVTLLVTHICFKANEGHYTVLHIFNIFSHHDLRICQNRTKAVTASFKNQRTIKTLFTIIARQNTFIHYS